jgi:hypothetical protein
LPYQLRAIIRARISGELKDPLTVKLLEIVTDPVESIVRLATPLLTKLTAPVDGLYMPVFALLANFKAGLARDPEEREELTPS